MKTSILNAIAEIPIYGKAIIIIIFILVLAFCVRRIVKEIYDK